MATPIQPGLSPITAPKYADYVKNAQQVGVQQSTAREVAGRADDQPSLSQKALQSSAPPSPAGPVSTQELPDGSRLSSAENGLQVNQSEQQVTVALPNGDLVVHQRDGRPEAVDAQGNPIQVTLYEASEGQGAGYGYTRADGTQVAVNLDDHSMVFQNKQGTVTQHLDAEGGQFIQVRTDYRDETGKFSKLEQQLYITPDGQVENLGADCEGLKVGQGEVSFRNPQGLRCSVDLPVPITHALQGDLAAVPKGAVAAPPADLTFNPGNPVLMEPTPGFTPPAATGLPQPTQESGWFNTSGDGPVSTPSGLYRFRTPEGCALQLQNGISLMDLRGDARLTLPDGSPGGPVSVTSRPRPNAAPESEYHFADGTGNRYTMFSDSLDFMVESADGRAVQVMMPDGSIYGAVRCDQGVKKFHIDSNGHNQHDPGMGFHVNPVTRQIDRIQLMGDSNPVVALPYAIEDSQAGSGQYPPGAGAQFPVSGQMPPIFGQGPGQPTMPTPPGPTPWQAGMPGPEGPNPWQAGMPGPQGPGTPPPLFGQTAPAPPPPSPGPGGASAGAPPPPPPPGPGGPAPDQTQAPVRPGFFNRLKYLFSGNNQDLRPGQRPAGPPPPQMGYPNYGYPDMGGYPGCGYGWSNNGMNAMFGTYMAMETASTMAMGMGAMMSSFMPWGMGYYPFMWF